MSSRGTNYLLSINDDGTTDVTVLEGTVAVEQVLSDDQSGGQPPQFTQLLEVLNQGRDQVGAPRLKVVPEAVQKQINVYGNALIHAMKASGSCFHGNESEVGSPFTVVKLPTGWSVLGEVLGCPAEAGLWTPASLSNVWWNSSLHQRIVFKNNKASAIGCVWSKPGNRQELEVIVCLILNNAGSTPALQSPILIKAGYRFRFSSDGHVLSTYKLGPGDYRAILGGQLFTGFASKLPEVDALIQFITETMNGVALPLSPGT